MKVLSAVVNALCNLDGSGDSLCSGGNSDWAAAAVRSAQPATNNPFASPDVPETAPIDGFGDSAFGGGGGAPADGAAGDGGFGESAFGEKPAFGASVLLLRSVAAHAARYRP